MAIVCSKDTKTVTAPSILSRYRKNEEENKVSSALASGSISRTTRAHNNDDAHLASQVRGTLTRGPACIQTRLESHDPGCKHEVTEVTLTIYRSIFTQVTISYITHVATGAAAYNRIASWDFGQTSH